MIEPIAIYQMPSIKTVFFVVPDDFSSKCTNIQLKHLIKEMIYLYYYHPDTENTCTMLSPNSTVRLIRESDFLLSLREKLQILQTSSSQSFHIPENMELLTINIVETPAIYPDPSSGSLKILSQIDNSDIIEVFI